MRDIIFIFIFSSVLLFFSIFPAIKLTEYIINKFSISYNYKNLISILLTIIISIIGGIFLRYF